MGWLRDDKWKKVEENFVNQLTRFLNIACPGLPESEIPITFFRCRMEEAKGKATGKLIITNNFIVFVSTKFNATIPISRILKAEKHLGKGIFPTRVTLRLAEEQHILKQLSFRNDVAVLINYLIAHNPLYISTKEEEEEEEEIAVLAEEKATHVETTHGMEKSESFSAAPSKSWFSHVPKQEKAESAPDLGRWAVDEDDYESVDVQTTKKVTQLCDDILEVQGNTRVVIQEQAAALDRIERNIDVARDNAKKGNHIANGMSNSIPHLISGAVGGSLHKDIGVEQKKDHSYHVDDEEAPPCIPILLRKRSGKVKIKIHHYIPASIEFLGKVFVISQTKVDDSMQDEEVRTISSKPLSFAYNELEELFIESQPLHIGFIFVRGEEVEMLSSFIQFIVNELVLRCDNLLVHFAPSAHPFDYGHQKIRRSHSESSSDCFIRSNVRLTETIFCAVPKETKKAIEEQENGIEYAQKAVHTLLKRNQEAKQELERQTDQLKNIHSTTDETISRVQKVNHKIA